MAPGVAETSPDRSAADRRAPPARACSSRRRQRWRGGGTTRSEGPMPVPSPLVSARTSTRSSRHVAGSTRGHRRVGLIIWRSPRGRQAGDQPAVPSSRGVRRRPARWRAAPRRVRPRPLTRLVPRPRPRPARRTTRCRRPGGLVPSASTGRRQVGHRDPARSWRCSSRTAMALPSSQPSRRPHRQPATSATPASASPAAPISSTKPRMPPPPRRSALRAVRRAPRPPARAPGPPPS